MNAKRISALIRRFASGRANEWEWAEFLDEKLSGDSEEIRLKCVNILEADFEERVKGASLVVNLSSGAPLFPVCVLAAERTHLIHSVNQLRRFLIFKEKILLLDFEFRFFEASMKGCFVGRAVDLLFKKDCCFSAVEHKLDPNVHRMAISELFSCAKYYCTELGAQKLIRLSSDISAQ